MGNESKTSVGKRVCKFHTLSLKFGHRLLDIVAIERNVSDPGGFAMVAILSDRGMHAHVGFG